MWDVSLTRLQVQQTHKASPRWLIQASAFSCRWLTQRKPFGVDYWTWFSAFFSCFVLPMLMPLPLLSVIPIIKALTRISVESQASMETICNLKWFPFKSKAVKNAIKVLIVLEIGFWLPLVFGLLDWSGFNKFWNCYLISKRALIRERHQQLLVWQIE